MDREELARLVRATGCVLRGGPGEFDCPTTEAKGALLNLAATYDARYDPRVRELALRLLRGAPSTSPAAIGRALHAAVKRRVRYVGEAIDTFQSAWQTWASGFGDCDDSARLLVALARSVGVEAGIQLMRNRDGIPVHVVAVLHDGQRWQYAEATLDAEYGEPPIVAWGRLRAAGKPTVLGA